MTNPQVPDEEIADDLLEAVRGLTNEVRGLKDRLDRLYAPRDEVKREGRRRAWRFLGFAFIIILVAQALTMGSISYCFLDPARANSNNAYCSLMPGYGQAVSQSADRLGRFERLLSGVETANAQAEQNENRLEDIEKRLDKLEASK